MEFLDFVKTRAGLLIEVGDQQYSFVHLTFQEYLAAMHVATTNESGGADAIWKAIATRSKDARWHEVIRLLIAGLRSPMTQIALVGQLLSSPDTKDVSTTELLGGLVLDGIDAAEERLDAIIQRLVAYAAAATSLDDCQRLVRIVLAWRRRDSFSEDILSLAMDRAAKAAKTAEGRDQVTLLAPALGVDSGLLDQWFASHPTSDETRYLVRMLYGPQPGTELPTAVALRLESLTDILIFYIQHAPHTNRAATIVLALLANAPHGSHALWAFWATSSARRSTTPHPSTW